MENYIKYLIDWIQEEVKKANANGVLVAINNEIDSAFVAYLAKKAFPNDSFGLVLTIYDTQNDAGGINNLIEYLQLDYSKIDLSIPYMSLTNILPLKNKSTKIDFKSRLKMTTIFSIAKEKNYLVLGTINKSEYYIGNFTKYGDGAADLFPIINLNKTEIYKFANLIELPNELIIKKSSINLWKNYNSEKELNFTYKELDEYLENKQIPKEIEQTIILLHENSKYKREGIKHPKMYIKENN